MTSIKLRHLVSLYFAALCITFVSAVSTAQQLTIIADPGPFSSIEKAAAAEERVDWWDGDVSDDAACTECFAALELARFLPSCSVYTRENIRVEPASAVPGSGDVVILGAIGSNPLMKAYSLPDSIRLATDGSFCIRAFREKGRTVTVISGFDRTGVLYGTYGLLERLGVRFYGLGEKGTVFPAAPGRLPDSLTVVESPSFFTRGYHAWEDRGSDDFFLWMARNRMNFWTSAEKEVHLLKKLGMKLADGGHTIQMNFLNPKTPYPYNHPLFRGDEDKPADPCAPGNEYTGDTDGDGTLTCFEAHPEWYGLIKGKRSDNIKDEFGDNFCTSNVDACHELAKNMIQSLIDGQMKYVDIVNFWMMDATWRWCECENCKRQGTYTDRLMAVVDTMLRELKKARSEGRLHRPVHLSSLAYVETLEPPTKDLPDDFDYDNVSITFFPIQRCYDHTLADPSCTEYNSVLADNYLAWGTGQGRRYRGTMFIGEYYNISYLKSLPLVYTRIMATDIPWYYHTGTRHFHYMHTPTSLWGTWTLNQYLLARLLWDVTADADALVDEYFHRYYPTTTEETRQFYRDMEKGLEGFKALRYWGWKNRLKDDTAELYPKRHMHYEEYHPLTNDGADLTEMHDHIVAARKAIDHSLASCTDAAEKLRLIEDEHRFAYGEAMFTFHYHLFRTAMFHREGKQREARQEFASLERYASQLEGIVDLVQVASAHANAKNGLDATQAVDVYTYFKEKYGK